MMKKRKVLAAAVCGGLFCVGILVGVLVGIWAGNRQAVKKNPETVTEESMGGSVDEALEDKSKETGSVPEETQTVPPETKETKPEEEEPKELAPGEAVPSVCGALHVEGTQLTDESGRPVQLRGISTHGLQWFPQYVNEDCFRELRQNWNANVIRLAMYTAEGGYCEGDKEALKELVKNGVEYAASQDLYVIVDWHVLTDMNPNKYKDEAKAFFEEIVPLYADYDNVLYEICNEPNGNTSWSDVKSYAEEIIPVIRTYDEDAVILVGTPTWSQNVDQAAADPITGYDNIMYTLHFYAATHKDSLRNTMTAAIDAGLPVFVSEYGICDASGSGAIDESSSAEWISTMNAYGVSYVAWNLSNKNETSAILKSSCDKTSGFTENDLSTSGKWLYQMLTGKTQFETLERDTSAQGTTVGNGNGGNTGTGNGGGTGTGNGSSTGSSNGGEALQSGDTISLTSGEIAIQAEYMGSWEADGESCYQYNISLTNNGREDCTSWSIEIPFTGNIGLSQSWCGNFTVDGSTLKISAADFNGGIEAGGTIKDIGFIVTGSSNLRIVGK